MRKPLLAVALLLAAAPAVAKDEAALNHVFESADRFDADLFTPSGPALVTMGTSPRRATEPGAVQDFAVDLGSVSDAAGSHFALAFSTVPFWWGANGLTLKEYREETSSMTRILARTQASIGVATAGGDEINALRSALGFQTQLLDAQDHRFDVESSQCIHEAWQTFRRAAHEKALQNIGAAILDAEEKGGSADDIDLDALLLAELAKGSDAAYRSARESCQDGAIRRLIAKPSWLVGLGAAVRSEKDAWGDLDYDGLSAWTSYRQPLFDKGRYAAFGFLRGDMDRVFDFDDGGAAEGDAYTAGIGLAYQTPRLRVDLSAAHTHRSFSEGGYGDDSFQQYGATMDVRLFEGFWIEASGGFLASSDLVEGAYGSLSLKVSWGDYLPGF
ncbi:MAG: hypothetical protein H6923_03870 [Alphaproteobacteria bacterium]|nr:hypothetical protein [Alphaproteobacteria bacterium]